MAIVTVYDTQAIVQRADGNRTLTKRIPLREICYTTRLLTN